MNDSNIIKLQDMLDNGECRIVYENLGRCKAFSIEDMGYVTIFINPRYSYEEQKRSLLHECKHLEHFNCDKPIDICEQEAIEFSNSYRN